MARSRQDIFRVIVVHNKLLTEEDADQFLRETADPAEIIDKMLIGEMVSEAMGEKLLQLYHHNLKKQGLSVEPTPEELQQAASAPPASPAPAAPASPAGHAPAHHAEPAAHKPAAPTPAPAAHARHEAAASPPPQSQHHASADSSSAHVASVQLAAGGHDLIHQLLKAAQKAKASDLHVKADAIPIVRVATALRELPGFPKIPAEAVEHSLLSLLRDDQREHFLKTKDLDFSYDAPDPEIGRSRVSYLREHRGVNGIFRLINSKVPSFEELKLPEQIKKFTQYRQGIVLVTGPKGSGKTTTMAAIIDLINKNRAEHIITIEDPIEFVQLCKKGHVNQREVGTHTLSFANALRASLREAPDIIMVGEMRDLETTSLAITAAETGHLVFATLHTPDAPRTINRVLDVFPPKEQGQIRAMFSESLRGIISQQLIPDIEGNSLHLAVEILFNTSAIGNLIRDSRAFQVKGMMQTGKKLGMVLMDESLAKLAREGLISREEAIARADNIPQMERDLGMKPSGAGANALGTPVTAGAGAGGNGNA